MRAHFNDVLHPALRSKKHCAVGAGHAPPATLRQREHYGQPARKAFSHKKRAARRAAHLIYTLNFQLYTLHNYRVLHHPERHLRPAETQFVHAVGVVLVRRARVGAQNAQ